MELNPILRRDLRARWRNWRAFGLIFVYAALLAGVMGWQYATLIHESQSDDIGVYYATASSGPPLGIYAFPPSRSFSQRVVPNSFKPREHLAFVSRDLFRSLNLMQVIGWMLIAPALTASAIAGERERGLLESLQLSYLSAARIVSGKLLCALAFLILMLLIPLPIMAVCFTLGGISPGDFISAAALQIATAITCALIGLAVSAWSRRVNIALTKSFVYVLAWVVGVRMLSNFGGGSFYRLRGLNPLTAVQYVVGRSDSIYIPTPSTYAPSSARLRFLTATLNASNAAPWKTCIVFEIFLSLFLLYLAIRGTRKSFDAPQWIARKLWLDYLKRLIPQPDATTDGSEQWKQRARHALWWEFPLVSLVRFSNPILQREARNKLRLRGTGWKSGLLKLLLGGVGAYYYVTWFAMALDYAPSRAHTGWQIIYCGLGATIIACAVLGASAIPREREAGTWEAIGLSLLPKREVLSGKVLPPLLACLIYSLPVWPLIIACADFQVPLDMSSYHGGIFSLYIIAALLVIAATAWGCTALAMLISWRFQRAAVAVSWTIGCFLLFFIALPLLLSAYDSSLSTVSYTYGSMDTSMVYLNFGGSGGGQLLFSHATLQVWRYLHPLLALGLIMPWTYYWTYTGQNNDPLDACLYNALYPAFGLAVVWFLGGLIALNILRHLMRDNPRQADAHQRTGWLYAKL